MNFQQFLLVLQARWLVVAITLLVAVASTLVISSLLPKNYTATASLVVDFKGADPVAGVLLPAQLVPGYMATQLDIITSHNVALKVVRGLKLNENPVAKQQFMDATDGKGSIDDWLAELLLRKLDVKPARDSSVVNISYTATDPRFAAVVANAFAQAYMNANLELRVEPARQTARWFDDRTKALRDNLEATQAKMSTYQQEKGITSLDERLDVENARLNELSSQLVLTQAQTYEAQNRERKARELIAQGASADQLADVLANPLVISLKADVARSESKLQDAGTQFGKNHPQVLRQEAELLEQRKRLKSEIDNVVNSLSNATTINQRREAEIKKSLEAQKARVLEIKSQRDELSVLTKETESAQRSFDVAMQRFAQTSLESQANQTNIAVLNPAVEPLEPSSPKIFLNTLLSFVLGGMLGVGLALILELADRRVRSADDLRDAVDVPVLVTLGGDRHRKRLRFRSLRRRPPAAPLPPSAQPA